MNHNNLILLIQYDTETEILNHFILRNETLVGKLENKVDNTCVVQVKQKCEEKRF